MDIYLIERDPWKFKCLELYFKNLDNVHTVNADFRDFIKETQVECVVSPANSFGLMDGGYDRALTEWYGEQLQERVQQYIITYFYGEQPVGTSFIIDTNKDGQKLIHTPTMRVPQTITDPCVVYQCMRTTLITATENNVKSILIPMFGGRTGGVKPDVIAKMMRFGLDQLQSVPAKLDWEYTNRIAAELANAAISYTE